MEDEYSDTYANADGTLTTDESESPIRVQQNGGWVPVDYDLVHVDGGWAPKASPFVVVFSDGGETDAVTLGDGAQQVSMSWDVTLPAPTIDGATATYDLGDGESLVLRASARGFEQSLVLAQPPASLPRIKLPMDTSNLTMVDEPSGDFDFVDSTGAPVYSMPAPVMYGAAIDPHTLEPTKVQPVAADLVQTDAGPRLDLSPSMTW